MDAHRNMLALGLPPSLAAARAVLDMLMQRGAWGEAEAVLAGLVEAAQRRSGGSGEEGGEGDGGSAGGAGLDLQLDAEVGCRGMRGSAVALCCGRFCVTPGMPACGVCLLLPAGTSRPDAP